MKKTKTKLVQFTEEEWEYITKCAEESGHTFRLRQYRGKLSSVILMTIK